MKRISSLSKIASGGTKNMRRIANQKHIDNAPFVAGYFDDLLVKISKIKKHMRSHLMQATDGVIIIWF